MKNFSSEGIIIKRRNIGEADRILTVFSKKNGKIKVKAIGVRKITSRRSPHVELLNHCLLTLYIGRSLPILTEAQTIEDFSIIKEDLKKIAFAYHICELIDGLCAENQENKSVFLLLENTLSKLQSLDDPLSFVGEFEITLLKNLGFYPRMQYAQNLNTHSFIENILERRLKAKKILFSFS